MGVNTGAPARTRKYYAPTSPKPAVSSRTPTLANVTANPLDSFGCKDSAQQSPRPPPPQPVRLAAPANVKLPPVRSSLPRSRKSPGAEDGTVTGTVAASTWGRGRHCDRQEPRPRKSPGPGAEGGTVTGKRRAPRAGSNALTHAGRAVLVQSTEPHLEQVALGRRQSVPQSYRQPPAVLAQQPDILASPPHSRRAHHRFAACLTPGVGLSRTMARFRAERSQDQVYVCIDR